MAKKIPLYGLTGLLLTLAAWYLNWELEGLRAQWGFFLLWLGYILTVDGIVYAKKGNSILTRSPRGFFSLFIISAPFWWLFEVINHKTLYWEYLGKEYFSGIEYYFWCTIAFSTVIPAVFETTELVSSFRWFKRHSGGPKIGHQKYIGLIFLVTGTLMLALLLLWPDLFPYFMWISLYFMLEPLNVWLGNTNLLSYTGKGNWKPVLDIWAGTLICGFFWELWNFYSYPKWIYDIPHYNFWHVFEMPLLGYLGYLPFGLELFAFYQLAVRLLRIKPVWDETA